MLLVELVQGQLLTSNDEQRISAIPEERALDRARILYDCLKGLEKHHVEKLVGILTKCLQHNPAEIFNQFLVQESSQGRNTSEEDATSANNNNKIDSEAQPILRNFPGSSSPQERNTSEEDATSANDTNDIIPETQPILRNFTGSSSQATYRRPNHTEQNGTDPSVVLQPVPNNNGRNCNTIMNPGLRRKHWYIVAAVLVIAAVLLTIIICVLTIPATATGPKVEDPESEQCTNATQISIDGPSSLLSDSIKNLHRVNFIISSSSKVNWSKWELENWEAVCGITMDGFLTIRDILDILKKLQNAKTVTFQLGKLCSTISRNDTIQGVLLLKSLYKVGFNVMGASCNEFFRFAAEQLSLPNLSEILFENALIIPGNVDNIQEIFVSYQSNLKYINMYNVTVGKGATLFEHKNKKIKFSSLLAARLTFLEDSNERATTDCIENFRSSVFELLENGKCKVEIETPRELKVKCDA
ncbi:unnamed protein product [Allacma fusca]|uniref:Uncharacterized protein n=1 Tax=Allacma fusca TaxID=39272 RepID=A0A8J2L4A8_9HEXA|nr:unnamed protein product [Allacma fusca]